MTDLVERQDFRCGICQLKNAFHCEHDTPYRDQYLGIFDPKLPRDTRVNNRNAQKENSSSTGATTARQQQQVNSRFTDQNKKTTGKTTTTGGAGTAAATKSTDKDKQSTKSCVIL